MANILPSRPRTGGPRRNFAVVASQYNNLYTDGLVEGFRAEIEVIATGSPINVHAVPGSFEIPLAVQELAMRGGMDAIIAFGVLLEGETAHATLIADSVTKNLQKIALVHRIPVIHEVLLVKNEDQARARCLEPELNRGTEAARVAVRMAQALSDIRR
jgi:6,7-dimethyl-8-ribityllumazine synthase